MGYEVLPPTELQHFCFIYIVAAAACSLFYCIVLHVLQKRRPRSSLNGLLVMSGWPNVFRKLVSFVVVLFVWVPALLFACAHLGAAILAPLERWPFTDTFEYLICNMIAIGPMNSLTPVETFGQVIDLIISSLTFIITSTIIGFCASMGLILDISAMVPGHKAGAFGMVLVVLLFLFFLVFASSLVLAVIEGFDIWNCFLYMAGLMLGIQDPLTPFSPSTDQGNFFAALCSAVELAVAGAIIGILGSHKSMTELVIAIEGSEEPLTVANSGIVDEKFQNSADDVCLPVQLTQKKDSQAEEATSGSNGILDTAIDARLRPAGKFKESEALAQLSAARSRILELEAQLARETAEKSRLMEQLQDIAAGKVEECETLAQLSVAKSRISELEAQLVQTSEASARETAEKSRLMGQLQYLLESQKLNQVVQSLTQSPQTRQDPHFVEAKSQDSKRAMDELLHEQQLPKEPNVQLPEWFERDEEKCSAVRQSIRSGGSSYVNAPIPT